MSFTRRQDDPVFLQDGFRGTWIPGKMVDNRAHAALGRCNLSGRCSRRQQVRKG
jgi:hypothetical protein